MKTIPCLTQPHPVSSCPSPHALLLNSSDGFCHVSLFPTCSFPICFLVPSIQACSLSPSGLRPPNSSLFLLARPFSLCKHSCFQNREGAPQPSVSACPFPKFTAQPLPPSSRPKFHALPDNNEHVPLSLYLGVG